MHKKTVKNVLTCYWIFPDPYVFKFNSKSSEPCQMKFHLNFNGQVMRVVWWLSVICTTHKLFILVLVGVNGNKISSCIYSVSVTPNIVLFINHLEKAHICPILLIHLSITLITVLIKTLSPIWLTVLTIISSDGKERRHDFDE